MEIYAAIDLKSFYASVECVARGLDPLATHLVVADITRTEKTICLAVSPPLKALGVPARPRLFEVAQKVRELNSGRAWRAPEHKLTVSSCDDAELNADPSLALDYIIAPPRMAQYVKCSARIHEIYTNFISPEDIHVYSIDEVFIRLTPYLHTYRSTAQDIVRRILHAVLRATGITATAGIGTNLYLAKVALDIVAKHLPADGDGVRMAWLDERAYREKLWTHRPLRDFWRIGRGYAAKLEQCGLMTMGDIARCSLGDSGDYHNEDLLHKLFGVNAELLIDHAWGWEPCTIRQIKNYCPRQRSISSGQVLPHGYDAAHGGIIVREMAEALAFDLLARGVAASRLVLTLGYDAENLRGLTADPAYEVTIDHYGRRVPKHARGTENLGRPVASPKVIVEAAMALYRRILNPNLLIRRVTLDACGLQPEEAVGAREQLSLFGDSEEAAALQRERALCRAVLGIREKFGKNAVLKGTNLLEGATMVQRNGQIGGHRA